MKKYLPYIIGVISIITATSGTASYVILNNQKPANPAVDGVINPSTDGFTNPSTDGITNPSTDGFTNPSTDGFTNPSTDGNTIDEGITTGTITQLHNSLIVKNIIGPYFTKKVTINDTNNKDLIIYNIHKYLTENNINYKKNIDIMGETTTLLYEINKTTFNNYMKQKYNTSNKYDLPINTNQGYNFENTIELFSDNNNWVLKDIPKSGSNVYLKNKLVFYEYNDNEMHIYDKVAFCESDGSLSVCHTSITPNINNDVGIYCSYDNNGNITGECPVNSTNLSDMANYSLQNLIANLPTYKHTFKKIGNNWYWYSSEPTDNDLINN